MLIFPVTLYCVSTTNFLSHPHSILNSIFNILQFIYLPFIIHNEIQFVMKFSNIRFNEISTSICVYVSMIHLCNKYEEDKVFHTLSDMKCIIQLNHTSGIGNGNEKRKKNIWNWKSNFLLIANHKPLILKGIFFF